jgi:hypothetical protein
MVLVRLSWPDANSEDFPQSGPRGDFVNSISKKQKGAGMSKNNGENAKKKKHGAKFGFGQRRAELAENGATVIRRPADMSREAFNQLMLSASRPGRGDYSAIIRDDSVLVFKNNHSPGAIEMQILLDRFTASAPPGMKATAGVMECGHHKPRFFAHTLILQGDRSSATDADLDAATHLLVCEFEDRMGYVISGTLEALKTFLRHDTPEEHSMRWQRMYSERQALLLR